MNCYSASDRRWGCSCCDLTSNCSGRYQFESVCPPPAETVNPLVGSIDSLNGNTEPASAKAVEDAVSASDAVEKFNLLLANLRAAGLLDG